MNNQMGTFTANVCRIYNLQDKLNLADKECRSLRIEIKQERQDHVARVMQVKESASEELNQLSIALKIKTEEHDCCAEDLMAVRKDRKHVRYLLTLAYAKLYNNHFTLKDPALMSQIEKYLQNTGD